MNKFTFDANQLAKACCPSVVGSPGQFSKINSSSTSNKFPFTAGGSLTASMPTFQDGSQMSCASLTGVLLSLRMFIV